MAVFPLPVPDSIYSLRFRAAGTSTANFVDNEYQFTLPTDATKQGWSKGIRVVSSSGGYVEFSFDGVNVHGRVDNGAVAEYQDRYEAGIAVRGSGDYVIEAW